MLTSAQLTALFNEVKTDPLALGYAVLLPAQPGRVVELMNKLTQSMVKSRMVTARAIIAECPNGGAILDALEAVAVNNTNVKWAMKFLAQDAGIDIGASATRALIDGLVTATVLTAAQGTALKNLANQPASRSEVLGFGFVNEETLYKAGAI